MPTLASPPASMGAADSNSFAARPRAGADGGLGLISHAASMRRHWKSTEGLKMQRFVVSTKLPKFHRDQGFRAEIIDRKHPSDGGPVAIQWFKTKADADTALRLFAA
jgi:hypothetical protein